MATDGRRLMVGFILASLCLSAGITGRQPTVHAQTETSCTSPSPVAPLATGLPELRGVASHGQFWGLLFQALPLHTDDDIKIVWRMGGGGEFSIEAMGPDGTAMHPTWGPEIHGGSTWNRPGNEWGTGFRFTAAGCWHIHATRGSDSGDAWLDVLPPGITPVAPTWQEGWPMPGHDPQRTNLSPLTGPLHPRLLFQLHKVGSARTVAPDGTMYATGSSGLTAYNAVGRRLWRLRECCVDEAPILTPDGIVAGVGLRTPPGKTGTTADTEVVGIGPDGTIRWRIQPFGLLKGAQLLAATDNTLYVPIVGPEGIEATRYVGLNHLSNHGTVLQHSEWISLSLAQGRDGSLYSVGRPSGDNPVSLLSTTAGGEKRWIRSLSDAITAGPLVGQDVLVHPGVQASTPIYLGTANGVTAYDGISGRTLWHTELPSGAFALAQRSGGEVLAVGRADVSALDQSGKMLWSRPIELAGTYQYDRPSILADAEGRAYIGTDNGQVTVLAPNGQIVSHLRDGGKGVPQLALISGSRLIVSGAGGTVGVYAEGVH